MMKLSGTVSIVLVHAQTGALSSSLCEACLPAVRLDDLITIMHLLEGGGQESHAGGPE